MLDNTIQNILNDLQGKKKTIQKTAPMNRTSKQRNAITMLGCSIDRINYEMRSQNLAFNLITRGK